MHTRKLQLRTGSFNNSLISNLIFQRLHFSCKHCVPTSTTTGEEEGVVHGRQQDNLLGGANQCYIAAGVGGKHWCRIGRGQVRLEGGQVPLLHPAADAHEGMGEGKE